MFAEWKCNPVSFTVWFDPKTQVDRSVGQCRDGSSEKDSWGNGARRIAIGPCAVGRFSELDFTGAHVS